MLAGILLLLTLFSHINLIHAQAQAVESVNTAEFDVDLGTAHPSEPFWLEAIKHQGSSAYNSDPTYQVFRNVKDFGAKGNGIADDTVAINLAISSGSRCGGNDTPCNSSTLFPALVYFPKGVYLVSAPINTYYYTQLIGDAKNPPTLLASSNFDGMAVIDADPYIPGTGSQWFGNTNNFFRSVRNFIIDVRRVAPERSQGTGIHWQVAQATSLVNIVFEMSTAPGNAHQGIWMENGSGGFMGDLVFNGGKFGLWVGNQQFTVRNVTINNADTAILHHWNWAWTFQGITINSCNVGFDLLLGVSAVSIVDAMILDTPIAVRSAAASNTTLAGSVVIDNMQLKNVTTAVADASGASILTGGTSVTIKSWGQGNVFAGPNPTGTFIQGPVASPPKSSVLLDDKGRIFGKTHPQYADYSVRQFVSVKDYGARGDGKTDDTAVLQSLLNKYAGRKILFFDAGTYIVTSTLTVPAGTRMVGEAWSVIAGRGKAFSQQNKPQAVVKVGQKHSCGVVEITDMIFTTVGPAPGAIVVEWNIRQPLGHKGGAGMWDSHIRLGGAAGTELELANCPPGGEDIAPCMASFLALHLTTGSTAYLEGTWVWLADHDLDGDGASQISIYSGRGILSESEGPVWMIGTAEHHVLYQYRLVNARDHYMGLIQTESPYWQPVPAAPEPFAIDRTFKDPDFSETDVSAWALSIKSSTNIIILGAGLYSFFQNYTQTCLNTRDCQREIVDIDKDSSVSIYTLSTVASAFQISLDGTGIVKQSDNLNGFVSTVTFWASGKSHRSDIEVEVGIQL